MKSTNRTFAALCMLVVSPAVFAQVDVGGAASGAANVNPPTIQPPPPPPSPQVSGNVGAAAGANVTSPLDPAVKADANASLREQMLKADVPVATRASATLDGKDTVKLINRQTFETRDDLVAQIDARLDASHKAQKEISKSAHGLKGDAKARVSASMDKMEEREKALKKSLKAYRKASADEFAEARDRLSADYKAYAESVSEMETTVSAANKTRAEANAS